MASDVTSEEREVGVKSVDCPTCGKTLAAEEQPDGSVAAGNCSNCQPEATDQGVREQADEQPTMLSREAGTEV